MHFPAFSRARPCAIKQAPFSYVDELGEELVTQWCGVEPRERARLRNSARPVLASSDKAL